MVAPRQAISHLPGVTITWEGHGCDLPWKVTDTDVGNDEVITIIQHPSGEPKQIANARSGRQLLRLESEARSSRT